MTRTIDIIKEKRKVSEEVKNSVKSFNKLRKEILNSLESGEKTIPELAKEIDANIEDITYHLMTLQKYSCVIPGDMDDSDEYYYYKLKK